MLAVTMPKTVSVVAPFDPTKRLVVLLITWLGYGPAVTVAWYDW